MLKHHMPAPADIDSAYWLLQADAFLERLMAQTGAAEMAASEHVTIFWVYLPPGFVSGIGLPILWYPIIGAPWQIFGADRDDDEDFGAFYAS